MLLDLAGPWPHTDTLAAQGTVLDFRGVSSETGRLSDVLLCEPTHLEIVPCNEVSRDSIARGLRASPPLAVRQHEALAAALEAAGVRCHFVPPAPGHADLCFMRDAILIAPWGLIELRPAALHRRSEPAYVSSFLRPLGVPVLGRIDEGHVEGGDVCLLRDGLVLIGRSGDRTDAAGAAGLGALFGQRGWEVVEIGFDPAYLHLDTLFTMIDSDLAVACRELLAPALFERVERLGIEIIDASPQEVARLGANLFSLGGGRVVAPCGNDRLNGALESRGIKVITLELDQFTRCGGGARCLTMPLSRH